MPVASNLRTPYNWVRCESIEEDVLLHGIDRQLAVWMVMKRYYVTVSHGKLVKGPLQSGNRKGQGGTWKSRNLGIWRSGDLEIQKSENFAVWGPANPEICA